MKAIRVLVVDDEPTVRAALTEMIVSNDSFELAGEAEDADQAIEIARKQKPDIALVDVRIPGGGGPRATREICALEPRPKVLALSAVEDRDAVLGMLVAGASGYLLKGVSPERITQALIHAVEGQAVLSRGVTAGVIEELVRLLNASEQLAEEFRALDRTKSELVQILSHELRTPVTVIQGVVKILGKADHGLPPETIADISASALRATQRLTRLAANVVAAARLARNSVEIPMRPVPVEELFSKAAAEFPQQEDQLVFPTYEATTMTLISANRDLAVRALVLVIENALDLSPEGGIVEIGVRVDAGSVEMQVADRGPGIPENKQEQIFEPFSQIDSSITRTHQGLGIGLYLARLIMTAHQGTLEAMPRSGGGTTLVLGFPALETPRPPQTSGGL